MNLIHAAIAVLLLISNPSEANHLRRTKGSRDLKKKTRSNRTMKSASSAKAAKVKSWEVVVNNANIIPPPENKRRSLEEEDEKTFSSYNAASVNEGKDVVFRARSTGQQNKEGGPKTGIYTRKMSQPDSLVIRQASRGSTVPQPNNIDYQDELTPFIEFPSFPRIALSEFYIATRAMHQPVWKYLVQSRRLQGEVEVEYERSGNTGLYFSLEPSEATEDNTSSTLKTGVPKLGNVDDFKDQFRVPGVNDPEMNIAFDVFPGSPSIDDDKNLAFKGNYLEDGVAKTGVFYRKLEDSDDTFGGDKPIYVIANSDTFIPTEGAAESCEGKNFGSTASPSIAGGFMVFRGVDDEDDPKCGGIYKAKLDDENFPKLKPLVQIGDAVPGIEGVETFTRFGEGLSFDGKAVAFWAALGDDTVTLTKCCPEHGNKDRSDFCNNKDLDTIDGTETDIGCMYQEVEVPSHQGIFVYNEGKGEKLRLVKETYLKQDGSGTDLLHWNYSGKPPVAGPNRALEDDTDAAEPPRWRSAAFAALMEKDTVAYKMTTTTKINEESSELETTAGIYTGHRGKHGYTPHTILQSGDSCTDFDELAVVEDGQSMTVESVAIERDGFRNDYLCVAVACGTLVDSVEDDDEGDWGGIYCANMEIQKIELDA